MAGIARVRAEHPTIPKVRPCWLAERRRIIVIGWRFCEEKDVFYCARRPILHTLWHCGLLDPHDSRTKYPAIRLQRERDSPRQSHQIAVFQPPAIGHLAVTLLNQLLRVPDNRVGSTIAGAPIAGVTVADVEPKRTVVLQHAPHLAKDFDEVRHVLIRR